MQHRQVYIMTNKVSSVSIQTIHNKRPNYRKLLWTIQYNQDGQNVEMNVLTDENRMPLYSATHLHFFQPFGIGLTLQTFHFQIICSKRISADLEENFHV